MYRTKAEGIKQSLLAVAVFKTGEFSERFLIQLVTDRV